MPETKPEQNIAKILAAIYAGYFGLLSLVCLALLMVDGTRAFGNRSEQLFSFSAWVWSLQFFVLAIGVINDRRTHEELLPKALLSLFLGGIPSIYLVYRLLD